MVTDEVHIAHTMTLLGPLEYKEYTTPCRFTTSKSALIAFMSSPLSFGVRRNSSLALLLIYLHHHRDTIKQTLTGYVSTNTSNILSNVVIGIFWACRNKSEESQFQLLNAVLWHNREQWNHVDALSRINDLKRDRNSCPATELADIVLLSSRTETLQHW